jgi:hypothetical protein
MEPVLRSVRHDDAPPQPEGRTLSDRGSVSALTDARRRVDARPRCRSLVTQNLDRPEARPRSGLPVAPRTQNATSATPAGFGRYPRQPLRHSKQHPAPRPPGQLDRHTPHRVPVHPGTPPPGPLCCRRTGRVARRRMTSWPKPPLPAPPSRRPVPLQLGAADATGSRPSPSTSEAADLPHRMTDAPAGPAPASRARPVGRGLPPLRRRRSCRRWGGGSGR